MNWGLFRKWMYYFDNIRLCLQNLLHRCTTLSSKLNDAFTCIFSVLEQTLSKPALDLHLKLCN